jgi:hypothetical protein
VLKFDDTTQAFNDNNDDMPVFPSSTSLGFS